MRARSPASPISGSRSPMNPHSIGRSSRSRNALSLPATRARRRPAALDRATRDDIPITSTLGRHKNDQMLSFYMQSPGGFDVEIGTGGLRVGTDWVAHEFCEGDVWGHQGLTAEAILKSTLRNEIP
ncbi:MAG: hypothetical protein GY910_05915 [bacterium]|nr:hypothetical protein [bacterium]